MRQHPMAIAVTEPYRGFPNCDPIQMQPPAAARRLSWAVPDLEDRGLWTTRWCTTVGFLLERPSRGTGGA